MQGACQYSVVVIGASSGGLDALSTLLSALPGTYRLPVIVVQHRSKEERDLLETVLQHKCEIRIKQADEKEKITAGFVYIAPPNYHLMIESDMTFSLSVDESVKFSRPSIDVLFETASHVYAERLIGIILTGSGSDGAGGMLSISEQNGFTIAQDPGEAHDPAMPIASIRTGAVKRVLPLKEIIEFLKQVEKS